MNTKRIIISAVIILIAVGLFFAFRAWEFLPFAHASTIISGIIMILCSAILLELWYGIANVSLADIESLHSLEKRHPYLPAIKIIIPTAIGSVLLVMFALYTIGGVAPFDGENALQKLIAFFSIAGLISLICQLHWKGSSEYVFAIFAGTIIAFVMLGFSRVLFMGTAQQNPFLMALAVVCTIFAWRFLFGPWDAHVKSTVLGSFIFWLSIHILLLQPDGERMKFLLAVLIALIPAFIWIGLFMEYHIQKKAVVVLMFFAGMLSTAPILFYDALVRHGVQFQFFLFTIIPENFNRSSSLFVTDSLRDITTVKTALYTAFISFLIVGFIEELSKVWVLKRSGQRFFESIADVLQLSIIVAIGFAFAENILNPMYFQAFVKNYLIDPPTPEWLQFLGNALGRSILTTMVHILASGLLGYFLGVALFKANPDGSKEPQQQWHLFSYLLHAAMRVPEKTVFRRETILLGFVIAVLLHGIFNFLVTLSDLLPGNPRTIGELFNMSPDSFLNHVSLLLVPSLLYVVGGLWLLGTLLSMRENQKVRGRIIPEEIFVLEKAHA